MRHSASLWKRLFLLLAAILLGTALLAGGYLAYVWYRFAPPDAVGARITVPGGTLESVSREWFAQGTAALRGGWLVPPAWRVADAALDQVEVLQTTEDGGFVQLDYTVHLKGWFQQKAAANLEAFPTETPGVYTGQTVLQWRCSGAVWVLEARMRPAAWQLQSPEMQAQREIPQPVHYLLPEGVAETYYIADETLWVTYDGGASFTAVPDGYALVCRTTGGAWQEDLGGNGCLVSRACTAFVGYDDAGAWLLYSLDGGGSWQRSLITEYGYRANSFISSTGEGYYVTVAVDRAAGSDYYETYRSADLEHWEPVSPGGEDPASLCSNLTCVYWAAEDTAYYCRRTGEAWRVTAGAATPITWPEPADTVARLGYMPFDCAERMYTAEGVLYLVVGQGDDGDYTRDGRQIRALYRSTDGVYFEFVEERPDDRQQAG